jgi:hypothetical protein
LWEVDEAANRVRQEVDPDANIIVGATFDLALGDRVRVSIVASGMARSAQMGRGADDTAKATAPSRPSKPASRAPDDYRHRLTEAIGGSQDDAGGVYHSELSTLSPATRAKNGAAEPASDARRNGSRMPAVEDFPPVGQREYWAKSGDAHNRGIRPELEPATQHTPESPAPKTSLLRRLTGGGRGRRETPPASVPGTDDSASRLSPQLADDNVDLPVFFGRKKR